MSRDGRNRENEDISNVRHGCGKVQLGHSIVELMLFVYCEWCCMEEKNKMEW